MSNEVTQVIKSMVRCRYWRRRNLANFNASKTSSCAVPFNVEFTNTSDPHQQYIWDFEMATPSSAQPCSYLYKYCSYTVTLIAVSNCKTDTVSKTAYIIADDKLPCIYQCRQTASVKQPVSAGNPAG
jgi:PKD repeat protein